MRQYFTGRQDPREAGKSTEHNIVLSPHNGSINEWMILSELFINLLLGQDQNINL
jgi:hypothetical protein